jgi:hypothetical protein
MTVVHVRVLEIRTSETHTRVNKLLLFFESRSTPKAFRGDVRGEGFLQCDGTWKFHVLNQSSEFLAISLKRRHFFTADDAVAKCTLPLTWFPTNCMVREWFPMVRENDPSSTDIRAMIHLEVHVETRGAEPFMVAFSNLRVVPTWPRPNDPGEECPAPPQVVYVVAENPTEPGGAVSYRPIGCSQYPDGAQMGGGLMYAQPAFAPPQGPWAPPTIVEPRG